MLKKRIIPCLDIKDGRVVKGVNFLGLKDAGDPVELAKRYCKEGADELVFLDITATNEQRKTLTELVKRIALEINIPFAVGGGIHSVEDANAIIDSGADKISINSAAILNPKLITEIADKLGGQAVILAVDTKFGNDQWMVFRNGGKIATGLKTTDWVKQGVELGAGEILLTSMNNDGTKNGFAIDITKEIAAIAKIPVIASGGAGTMAHFAEVFKKTKATGALAASVFHYAQISIPSLKQFLKNKNISIR